MTDVGKAVVSATGEASKTIVTQVKSELDKQNNETKTNASEVLDNNEKLTDEVNKKVDTETNLQKSSDEVVSIANNQSIIVEDPKQNSTTANLEN